MVEFVYPTTYASPEASIAMETPKSVLPPPRYVEYTKAVPVAFNFVTKTSLYPPLQLAMGTSCRKQEEEEYIYCIYPI